MVFIVVMMTQTLFMIDTDSSDENCLRLHQQFKA